MSNHDERYVQPTSVTQALELIQQLFNSYRNEPLTQALLTYHNQLIFRLQDDIKRTAKVEAPAHLTDIDNMTKAMRAWTNAKLTGQPYRGKMKHFKFVPSDTPKFKTKVHKISGSSSHRSSRH
ncbi:hypothetical protein [Limosilactobacillus equigenerosi]|uniref:Uncharacterized protein n=1 Tax=Limosilactobacillus equigenerosi DSM 18793 = JCM 14505 TaxID=1423742 RepID=A0A0R1UPU3_9LACO|nr:hypothetical protein [Limosilactobacillus equigenerosi]KRL93610.1 hypothetical protein FC21_GL001523 [Limosilactobacillus equigenerosi DSM 18793 = JCM 14505]